jgi:hypothetical protein
MKVLIFVSVNYLFYTSVTIDMKPDGVTKEHG